MEKNEIEFKVKENKMRRAAQRQGYELKKSRARYTYPRNINDYGGYMIVDSKTNAIKAGEKYTLTLEEVEKILFDER